MECELTSSLRSPGSCDVSRLWVTLLSVVVHGGCDQHATSDHASFPPCGFRAHLPPTASLYALFRVTAQTMESNRWWMGNFTQYAKSHAALESPAAVPGHPGRSTPAKVYWFSSTSFNFNFEEGGKTMSRHALTEQYAVAAVRGLGVPTIDAMNMTKAMWDSSVDGTHYMWFKANERTFGAVSGMVFQTVLNMFLSGCPATGFAPSTAATATAA